MTEFFRSEREKHALWIDEMDWQHQSIVSLMEGLSRRDAERASKAELSSLLDTLRECTARHFKEEEAFMAATGYPKLDVHQVIHRDLLLKLEGHINQFKSGGGRLGTGLLSFLKYWLAAHITGADRQYSGHEPRQSAATEIAAETAGAVPVQAGERP
jgi:hemerythrin